jgi:hypothetical protein
MSLGVRTSRIAISKSIEAASDSAAGVSSALPRRPTRYVIEEAMGILEDDLSMSKSYRNRVIDGPD